MFNHKRIIIVTPERLGDTLMCTPAIHYLKHYCANSTIDVIALSTLSAETLQNNPDIHEVFILPSDRWLKKQPPYDIAINLHDGPQARRYLQLLKIPTYTNLPLASKLHQAEQALQFIQQLLPKHPAILSRNYQLYANAHDYQNIENALKKYAVDPLQDKLIACQIGCHSIAKRGLKFLKKRQHPKVWPMEYIIELGKRLQKLDPHLRLVLTGSKGEERLGKKIQRAIPNCINLVNQTTVTQLKALMRYVHAFISPDSGLMHVACSSNAPLIALFGPTDLKRTGPYPNLSQLTLLQGHTMEEIDVEMVLRAVLQFTRLPTKTHAIKQSFRQTTKSSVAH